MTRVLIATFVALFLGSAGWAQVADTPKPRPAKPGAKAERVKPAAKTGAKDKLQSCNARADKRNLTGERRREFIENCLA